jgi:hypothetical protein
MSSNSERRHGETPATDGDPQLAGGSPSPSENNPTSTTIERELLSSISNIHLRDGRDPLSFDPEAVDGNSRSSTPDSDGGVPLYSRPSSPTQESIAPSLSYYQPRTNSETTEQVSLNLDSSGASPMSLPTSTAIVLYNRRTQQVDDDRAHDHSSISSAMELYQPPRSTSRRDDDFFFHRNSSGGYTDADRQATSSTSSSSHSRGTNASFQMLPEFQRLVDNRFTNSTSTRLPQLPQRPVSNTIGTRYGFTQARMLSDDPSSLAGSRYRGEHSTSGQVVAEHENTRLRLMNIPPEAYLSEIFAIIRGGKVVTFNRVLPDSRHPMSAVDISFMTHIIAAGFKALVEAGIRIRGVQLRVRWNFNGVKEEAQRSQFADKTRVVQIIDHLIIELREKVVFDLVRLSLLPAPEDRMTVEFQFASILAQAESALIFFKRIVEHKASAPPSAYTIVFGHDPCDTPLPIAVAEYGPRYGNTTGSQAGIPGSPLSGSREPVPMAAPSSGQSGEQPRHRSAASWRSSNPPLSFPSPGTGLTRELPSTPSPGPSTLSPNVPPRTSRATRKPGPTSTFDTPHGSGQFGSFQKPPPRSS